MKLPRVPIDEDLTLEIPLDDGSYKIRVAKDIVIDMDDLQKTIVKAESWIGTLGLAVAHYEAKLYLRRQDVDAQEKSLKQVYAQLYNEIQESKAQGEKLTEKGIESRILNHKTYMAAQEAVNESQENVGRMIEVVGSVKAALEKARSVREDALKFYLGETGADQRRDSKRNEQDDKDAESRIGRRFRDGASRSK